MANETLESSGKFSTGVTLKFGAGFEAPWLTPRVQGDSADEVAKDTAMLLKAFADNGVLELVAQAAETARALGAPAGALSATAPKKFEGGRVVVHPTNAHTGSCMHGPRVFREGVGAKGPWAALFCGAPQGTDKSEQCQAMWRQKNGSFA